MTQDNTQPADPATASHAASSQDAAGPILSMTGISKAFGGVAALRGVSLHLQPGEVHALVGENGAGKSTLIKVLTGVHRQDAGEIVYAGEPVRFERPLDAQLAGISTIYQEINLVPLISVARNIFLGREPRTRWGLVDFRRMNEDATRLLAEVGIDIDVRRELRVLGTGTQQMVAIARAVSTDARIVIMDEPTSSLEPREVTTLFGVIEQLTARGIAVVYVSHRMDELYRICHRVTVLRDGQLVHTGLLADLSRRELIAHMLGRPLASAGDISDRDARRSPDGSSDIEPVLDVRDLERRHLLHDIDLRVAAGEVVGLGGLLGSGRSETVRAIAGAMKVDGGRVEVNGRRTRPGSTSSAIRLGISLLTEDRKSDGIVPNLTVRENIVLAALPKLSRFGIVSERKQRDVVDIFMRRLRIKAASVEQKVGELSGGNQQKVLLARWLCLSPRVLLLDEPTRGIDVGAKAEVQQLVAELAAEGLAVVLISSEIEELIAGADRIVALREGMVIGELTGADVTEHRLMETLSGGDDVVTPAPTGGRR